MLQSVYAVPRGARRQHSKPFPDAGFEKGDTPAFNPPWTNKAVFTHSANASTARPKVFPDISDELFCSIMIRFSLSESHDNPESGFYSVENTLHSQWRTACREHTEWEESTGEMIPAGPQALQAKVCLHNVRTTPFSRF